MTDCPFCPHCRERYDRFLEGGLEHARRQGMPIRKLPDGTWADDESVLGPGTYVYTRVVEHVGQRYVGLVKMALDLRWQALHEGHKTPVARGEAG